MVSWHDQLVPLAGSVNIGPDVLLVLVSSVDAGRKFSFISQFSVIIYLI